MDPMKRATVVGMVVAAVLIGGVGAAVAVSAAGGGAASPASSRTAEPTPVVTETPEADGAEPVESAAPDTVEEPAPAPGAYVEYSDAALAAAEGTAVLFFHAPWCPQCRALEEDILAAGVPDGVTILKVDYDSRQDLRQRYGVTLQTTVVALDGAGAATASFVPYDDPTLDTALSGLGLAG